MKHDSVCPDYPRATWVLPAMVTSENWRSLTASIDGAVASVAHGYDPIAAGNLIRFFHFAFQDGELFGNCDGLSEPERGFIEFVQMAFGRYVDKGSLDVAFGVARSPGRINQDNDARNVTIAASVELAVRRDLKGRGSVNIESVCKEVAPNFNLSWKSVEKIYAEYRAPIQTLGDGDISALVVALPKSA